MTRTVFRPLAGGIAVSFALAASAAFSDPNAYQLERSHADLLFSVNHLGFSVKHGQFRDFSGGLEFDVARPERSKLSVTINAGSIDTGDQKRDADLKGKDFFDVASYPQIEFASSRITGLGKNAYRVEGLLTMHGQTKPVLLEARINKIGANPFDHKPTVGFSAHGTLKRSAFGIARFAPAIGDEISITIDVEFNQKGQ